MGRWTQYDEDDYRLGGLKRTAYDADTQTYTFTDPHGGAEYKSVPGSQYAIAGRAVKRDPVEDRPHASATTLTELPSSHRKLSTFQEFLPANAIATSPTSAEESPNARSRFIDAARRTTMPRLTGVVAGLKRSATTARKPDDEKRGLIRNPSVASSVSSFHDEMKSLGRAATRKFSLRRDRPDLQPPLTAPAHTRSFSLRKPKASLQEEDEEWIKVENSMGELSLDKKSEPRASAQRRYRSESSNNDEALMRQMSSSRVSESASLRRPSPEKKTLTSRSEGRASKHSQTTKAVASESASFHRDLPSVPSTAPKGSHDKKASEMTQERFKTMSPSHSKSTKPLLA